MRMNPCACWQRLSQCLPVHVSYSSGKNKLRSVVKAEVSIQDLYCLTTAILGFTCLTFVSPKSAAKMVDNTINQKKGQWLSSNQGCGNWMQIL